MLACGYKVAILHETNPKDFKLANQTRHATPSWATWDCHVGHCRPIILLNNDCMARQKRQLSWVLRVVVGGRWRSRDRELPCCPLSIDDANCIEIFILMFRRGSLTWSSEFNIGAEQNDSSYFHTRSNSECNTKKGVKRTVQHRTWGLDTWSKQMMHRT